MKYPKLTEIPTSRELVDVFKGYNHNLRIGDGEFYDMTNLSSDNYPVFSPRHKRGIYKSTTDPQGMIEKDALCYVDGSSFYINENENEMNLSIDKKPKTLVSMGAYVIILPDKKYINTEKPSDFGDIDAHVTSGENEEITFELCKSDGGQYENVVTSNSEPKVTEEMEADPTTIPLWLDTSSTPNALKQYSVSTSTWNSIATTHIKIKSNKTDIGLHFSVGDAVSISGVTNEKLLGLNASTVIVAKDESTTEDGKKQSKWIVVTGIIDNVVTQNTPICISRWSPDFDYVVESGNRLWGCKYGFVYMGKAYDSKTKETVDVYSTEPVNEIYACKLGDFKNWNCFSGISTDSYAASLGTDGQFTGAITHLGYPLFFKENYVHKVYGNYPANYQIQTTACRGVQKHCDKSLAIVNEVLYYKSRSGICAYDGSLPMEISSALGEMTYENAVAGALGNKYYVSMKDTNNDWHLFVYDTLKGMWHREDDTQVVDFCNCRGDLYFIDYADKQIKTVRGTGVTVPSPIKWEAITGVLGTNSPDKKYISRLDVRMSLEVGARVAFYAEYDSSGEWEYLFTMTGTKLGSFAVPIRPQRCDHIRLKIVGSGDAKIFSICKTTEQGSDV